MVECWELHKKGAAGSKDGCEPRGGGQKVGGRQARGEAFLLGLKAAGWALGQVGGKAGLGNGQACESGGWTSAGPGGDRGQEGFPFPRVVSQTCCPFLTPPDTPTPVCGMLGVGPLRAITATTTTTPTPSSRGLRCAPHGLSADGCSSQNLVSKVLIYFIE